LDVLNILANVAGGGDEARAAARHAIGNISEWFEEYIATEEADPAQVRETCRQTVILF
jgi:hypothetical protein